MPSRRQVMLGIGVLTAGAGGLAWLRRAQRLPAPLYFSALDDARGNHFIAALGPAGEVIAQSPVPERAHSVALAPDAASALFFARRPGREAWRLDVTRRGLSQVWHAAPGRHFYGHGCFAAAGTRLYTTENDYENARGVIVERDAHTGAVLREFESHGVGPHDIRLLSDGDTLVVANGGIRTHPARPREKLNLDSMRPNLAYIDRHTGILLERHVPPHHQLSIRHLWVAPYANAGDWVGVAMQYQGPVADRVPLVAFHQRGQPLQAVLAPLAEQRAMRGYTASICIHPRSGIAAVTCPRGDRVTLWHVGDAAFLGSLGLADASGANLAVAGDGFLITTGTGRVAQVRPDGAMQGLTTASGGHWDNHLVGAAG